jgi:hypothetical protein
MLDGGINYKNILDILRNFEKNNLVSVANQIDNGLGSIMLNVAAFFHGNDGKLKKEVLKQLSEKKK